MCYGIDWSSGNPANSTDSPPHARSPSRSADALSERLLESHPSPTTASSAGSVPSPNSPPDSATVAASQNTDMVAMKDVGRFNKQSMISVITYPRQVR